MDAAQSALPDVTTAPEEGDAFDQPPCEVCKGRGRRRATGPPCVHCQGTGLEPWSLDPVPPPDPAETEPILHALKYLGLDLKDWRFAKGAGALERRDAIRREIRWQVDEGDRAHLVRADMAEALGISRQALHNIMVNNPTGRWPRDRVVTPSPAAQRRDLASRLVKLGRALTMWRYAQEADAAERYERICESIRDEVQEARTVFTAREIAEKIGITDLQLNDIMRGDTTGRNR